jgi:hypothetical protein
MGLVVLVALVLIATFASAGSAKADVPICDTWGVSFNNIARGYVSGCLNTEINPATRKQRVVARFEVCDILDEPGETNVVRAEIMVAWEDIFDRENLRYGSSPWFSARGDGTGCLSYTWTNDAPSESGLWGAQYARITVEAPGKATARYWPGFT